MNLFSNLFVNTETFASDVVTEFDKVVEPVVTLVEHAVESDVKYAFDTAHTAAINANLEVNRIKAELVAALATACDLHRVAVAAATSAAAAAEADMIKYHALIAAHASDLKAQSGQVVVQAVVSQPVSNVAVVA